MEILEQHQLLLLRRHLLPQTNRMMAKTTRIARGIISARGQKLVV
jgi:hypothetical protein